MKKISLYIRAAISFARIIFAKIPHPRALKSSPVQDFSLTARVIMREGGKITLAKRIHARRGVLIEAEGGSIEIGEGCYFGSGGMIVSKESVKIGSYTSFGPNVLVYDHDHNADADARIHDSGYKTSPVVIGSDVWIGANTVILRGARIGDGCVVGAGSVIKGEYPPMSIVIQKRADTVMRRRGGKEVESVV